MSAVRVLVTITGLGLIGLSLWGRRRRATPTPSPAPAPAPAPAPPSGWRPLTGSVTPEMRAQAVAVLNSDAPMGSMTPFTASDGTTYGVFVTAHPGTVRATEIWEPA